MMNLRSMPAHSDARICAQRLIEYVFKEMLKAVRYPERCDEKHWRRMFGEKDSMVVNIAKLVQALAALPEDDTVKNKAAAAYQQGATMTVEEMALLRAWLAEDKASDNAPGNEII